MMLMLALAVAGPPTTGDDARVDALSATLGRAHALHRRCAGPTDDLWRARMQAMFSAEHATPARRARLVTRFNAGFADAAAQFTACSSSSRAALAATLARGRAQAAELATRVQSTDGGRAR